jgi:hypothetical protein
MTILNEGLEWREIALQTELERAFRGTPVKTLFSPGALLCRFITTESEKNKIRGNEIFKSPWWMGWTAAIKEIKHWSASGATPKDVVRGRMAVTSDFNSELDSVVQIILTKPVYAWRGFARHQADTLRRVTYLGGGEQLYLPNLAADDKGLSSAVARMHCLTAVEFLT